MICVRFCAVISMLFLIMMLVHYLYKAKDPE